MSPGIGTLLDGKYRLLAQLGTGGMSEVFRAENILTGKQVAIKCVRAARRGDQVSAERLLREARAVSSLRHPGVVDVYDVGQSGSTPYLVMELLEGQTLRQLLLREPPPTVPELIARLLPALDGVAAAHAQAIVHRDLKPENIFLEKVPGADLEQAKVLDFGIAKLTAERPLALTQTGVALGTPSYMPLEQLRADSNVDVRADVYALGAILYEALAGRLPHEAVTLPELAIKLATTSPAPLGSVRPDLPVALTRIVDWSLARERDQRLPSVRLLRDELELFARERSFRNQMLEPAAALPRLPDPAIRGPRPQSAPHHRLAAERRAPAAARGLLRGLAAAAGLLGALASLAWLSASATPSRPRDAGYVAAAASTQSRAGSIARPAPSLEPAVDDKPMLSPARQQVEPAPPAADSGRPPPRPAARSLPKRAIGMPNRPAEPTPSDPGAMDSGGDRPRLRRADIAQLLAF